MNAPDLPHPDDRTLDGYGLGKLDPGSLSAVERHLEGCADCRRRVAAVAPDSVLGRLRDAREPPAGATPGGPPADATLSLLRAEKGPTAPPAADTLPPGLANHPDYEILRELGRGGMGVVYLAHNTMMGRDEVLKVIGRQIMERPSVLERFTREIRAVARLRHPNIVAAYAAFRIDGGLVFAMEHVEGLDLSRLVKARGPLPVAHAAYFIHQAALGLQHAHERGMVHRDIKPHNLMLTHDGKARVVKVLDFGLAKATREEKVDGGLTSQGQALGTPDYIAPEQILDAAAADIRADLYSLGATLFYLLTGRPPFQASSLYDLYQAHISRDADPLNLIRPEVPAELAALVAKMMAKDPARRFQEPVEVAHALTPFFRSKAAPPRAETSGAGPGPAAPAAAEWPAVIDPEPAIRPTLPAGSTPPAVAAVVVAGPAPVAAAGPSDGPRRPRRIRPAAAVAASLGLAAVAWWAGTFRVATRDGVIVLEGVPGDARIAVDGERITYVAPGDGKPVEIRAVPGEHMLRVEKAGFEAFGAKVAFRSGGSATVTVRLEPLADRAVPARPAPVGAAPEKATAVAEAGFTPLFNGKDPAGWVPSSFRKGGSIAVKDGVLVVEAGSGQHAIYQTEKPYGDVRIRAEVLDDYIDNGHLVVRTSEAAPNIGDRVALGGSSVDLPIGSFMAMKPPGIRWSWKRPTGPAPARPGEWFAIEIIDREDRVTILVDGKVVQDFKPRRRPRPPGPIRLACVPKSRMKLRKLEVQELGKPPDSPAPAALEPADPEPAQPEMPAPAGRPAAFYGFDGGEPADLSGHGRHGVFGDGPRATAAGIGEGSAMKFGADGVSRMIIPVDINPAAMPRITMGGWFKIEGIPRGAGLISHDDGDWDRSIGIDRRGQGSAELRWSAFTGEGVLGGKPALPGAWTFVCLRHDQATGRLALDVDETRLVREGRHYGAGRKTTTIGRHGGGSGRGFNGLVADVFIYESFLDDARVDEIRGRGRFAILGPPGRAVEAGPGAPES